MQSIFSTQKNGERLEGQNYDEKKIDNSTIIQDGFSVFQHYGRAGEDRATCTIHDGVIKNEKGFLKEFISSTQKASDNLNIYKVDLTENEFELLTQEFGQDYIDSNLKKTCRDINDGKSTYDVCSITRVAASTIQKSNNEEVKKIKPYKEYPEEQFSGSTSCITLVTKDKNDNVGFTISNIGDSGAALIIKKDDDTLLKIKLTEDHTPDLPRIRRKIEDKGGSIRERNEFGPQRIDGIAVGAALGDNSTHVLHTPDILEFKVGTQEYAKLEEICKKENIDLQQAIKDGKTRIIGFTDGIDDQALKEIQYDYKAEIKPNFKDGTQTYQIDKSFGNEKTDLYRIREKRLLQTICNKAKKLKKNEGQESSLDGEEISSTDHLDGSDQDNKANNDDIIDEILKPTKEARSLQQQSFYSNDYFKRNSDFIFAKDTDKEGKASAQDIVSGSDDTTLVSFDLSHAQKGKTSVIGIFDGHGGKFVADYAHTQLPKDLEKKLEKQESKMYGVAKVSLFAGIATFALGAFSVLATFFAHDKINLNPEDAKNAIIGSTVVACIGLFVAVTSMIAMHRAKPEPRSELAHASVEEMKGKDPELTMTQ